VGPASKRPLTCPGGQFGVERGRNDRRRPEFGDGENQCDCVKSRCDLVKEFGILQTKGITGASPLLS
jgi:hypothetical protein